MSLPQADTFMETSINTEAARRRPHSLQEVAQWGASPGEMDVFLREFLDTFYTEPEPACRAVMLRDEPPLTGSERANAYLAAVAEHLAQRNEIPVPAWVDGDARFLKLPFFPAGLESLKAICLLESPAAFRRRLIFVGADPLYRPRRDQAGFGS